MPRGASYRRYLGTRRRRFSCDLRGPVRIAQGGRDPFHLEFRDASGRLLTRTLHPSDSRSQLNSLPIPLSFVRLSSDLHRHLAATFSLAPGERLFGGGESFTRLDKRGQKMVLWTCDAYGAQTPYMYKPVPFFMSSRGYGVFVHTSAPATFDLGHSYDGAATVYLGDDLLDLFVFFGSPKEILSEYTALTGRAPTRPFGPSDCGWGARATTQRRRPAGWRKSCARSVSPQT